MRVRSASSTLPGKHKFAAAAQTPAIDRPIREPAVHRTTLGKLQLCGSCGPTVSAARPVSTWKTRLLPGIPGNNWALGLSKSSAPAPATKRGQPNRTLSLLSESGKRSLRRQDLTSSTCSGILFSAKQSRLGRYCSLLT